MSFHQPYCAPPPYVARPPPLYDSALMTRQQDLINSNHDGSISHHHAPPPPPLYVEGLQPQHVVRCTPPTLHHHFNYNNDAAAALVAPITTTTTHHHLPLPSSVHRPPPPYLHHPSSLNNNTTHTNNNNNPQQQQLHSAVHNDNSSSVSSNNKSSSMIETASYQFNSSQASWLDNDDEEDANSSSAPHPATTGAGIPSSSDSQSESASDRSILYCVATYNTTPTNTPSHLRPHSLDPASSSWNHHHPASSACFTMVNSAKKKTNIQNWFKGCETTPQELVRIYDVGGYHFNPYAMDSGIVASPPNNLQKKSCSEKETIDMNDNDGTPMTSNDDAATTTPVVANSNDDTSCSLSVENHHIPNSTLPTPTTPPSQVLTHNDIFKRLANARVGGGSVRIKKEQSSKCDDDEVSEMSSICDGDGDRNNDHSLPTQTHHKASSTVVLDWFQPLAVPKTPPSTVAAKKEPATKKKLGGKPNSLPTLLMEEDPSQEEEEEGEKNLIQYKAASHTPPPAPQTRDKRRREAQKEKAQEELMLHTHKVLTQMLNNDDEDGGTFHPDRSVPSVRLKCALDNSSVGPLLASTLRAQYRGAFEPFLEEVCGLHVFQYTPKEVAQLEPLAVVGESRVSRVPCARAFAIDRQMITQDLALLRGGLNKKKLNTEEEEERSFYRHKAFLSNLLGTKRLAKLVIFARKQLREQESDLEESDEEEDLRPPTRAAKTTRRPTALLPSSRKNAEYHRRQRQEEATIVQRRRRSRANNNPSSLSE